jgi:hypothetical protein
MKSATCSGSKKSIEILFNVQPALPLKKKLFQIYLNMTVHTYICVDLMKMVNFVKPKSDKGIK